MQSAFNQEKLDAQSERDGINNAISTLESASNSAVAQVQGNLDNSVVSLESVIANGNDATVSLETLAMNNDTTLVNEIARLDGLHGEDSKTLSEHEVSLDAFDVNISAEISSAMSQEDARHNDVKPKTDLMMEHMVIDTVNGTVTLESGFKVMVQGDFEQTS